MPCSLPEREPSLSAASTTDLLRTPLFDLHQELGARMVPFAGYSMPVQYPQGLMAEHLHTREAAGLFDVSHMGQISLRGPDAGAALESLLPMDVLGLGEHRQRYGLLLNEAGGILDDLMFVRREDDLFLIVNGACKHEDLAHIQARIGQRCEIEPQFDRGLLALQGPQAAAAMERLLPDTAGLVFMTGGHFDWEGAELYITRSGYTGEDGFEISLPASHAEAFARALLAQPEVRPVGLGARNSLRLEAGLCLYGHDMNTETTPVEASLLWAISKVRRADGARAAGFPGAEAIFAHQRDGVARKRVGLLPQERTPVREGADIVDANDKPVGKVCSGGFGPTLGAPVAMGYIDSEHSAIDTSLFALVRGKKVALKVSKMPFVAQRYYRG